MNDKQPAVTTSVLAGIIGAIALLVIARLNRSVDLFDTSELDQAKALVTLGAPFVAGLLIRRRVTPNARVQEHVDFGVAAGYAQGLQDGTAPSDDPALPAEVRPPRQDRSTGASGKPRATAAKKATAKSKPARPRATPG